MSSTGISVIRTRNASTRKKRLRDALILPAVFGGAGMVFAIQALVKTGPNVVGQLMPLILPVVLAGIGGLLGLAVYAQSQPRTFRLTRAGITAAWPNGRRERAPWSSVHRVRIVKGKRSQQAMIELHCFDAKPMGLYFASVSEERFDAYVQFIRARLPAEVFRSPSSISPETPIGHWVHRNRWTLIALVTVVPMLSLGAVMIDAISTTAAGGITMVVMLCGFVFVYLALWQEVRATRRDRARYRAQQLGGEDESQEVRKVGP
jgi:hypothetical protein